MTNETIDNGQAAGIPGQERDALKVKLNALTDIPPPRGVWQRIEQQADAEGLFLRKRGRPAAGLRWLAGAGIAAAVALATLSLPALQPASGPHDAPDVAANDASLPTVPAYDPAASVRPQDAVRALMVRSRLLEQDLRRLPAQPAVARTATLATIDELQLRIATIDQQLIDPDLPPESQARYWRERVRLMDSLLQLRYAQAQRVSF